MSATGTHILVVDDDPAICRILSATLTRAGHTVVVATDCASALEQLEFNEFDVVLSDIRMPGRDGLRLLSELRTLAPETPFIVVTAYADVETLIACVRGGAYDVVEKPLHLSALTAAVDRALEKRRAAVEAHAPPRGMAFTETSDPAVLANHIVGVVRQDLDADTASLMLLNDLGQLVIAGAHGLSDELVAQTTVALGEGVAGRVAADRKPALIQARGPVDPRFADLVGRRRTRSSVVYPLVVGTRLLGVLSVGRHGANRPFRQRELQRMSLLAMGVALAVDNLRLTREMAAQERLAAIGQLAAGVAHEINNPVTWVLASLKGMTEELDALQADDPVARSRAVGNVAEMLTDATEGAQRIREIVRDMRSLSRTDAALDQRFDINDAVHAAMRICTPALREAGARVQLQLGDDVEVLGSVGRMSQVVINLVTNAAHAVEGLEPSRRQITVRTCRQGDRVLVEVGDRGRGIAPHHVRRVFQPFFSTKAEGQGTGLGLSICQELVRRHGGVITVDSEVDVGTRFQVHLAAADPEVSALPLPHMPPGAELALSLAG
ncbi:MAG: response regulator [Myxococcota bacterium]